MGLTRGLLALPRMGAHRLVIVAAALTVVVAAALATALATFSGQALPRAVRHDLGQGTGTSMVLTGSVDAGQAARYTATLPSQIRSALGGTGFAFYQSQWSDALGFVPGSLPAQPTSVGNQPIVKAAALGDVTAQSVLVSGSWPGVPASGQPIPAAMPATAAALLHVTDGDVLRLRDRVTQGYVRFIVTGLYRPRQVTAEYWSLDDITTAGSNAASGFATYGPLTVPPAAFAGALNVASGTWLAVPQTANIPPNQLTTVAANVTGLQQNLQNAQQLPGLTVTTGLPAALDGIASDLDVARSLLAICAVLLFLLAAAALLGAARLLTAQREGESAMLTARGATRWQLARLTSAEAIPLCVLAAAAGGAAGVLLARLLSGTGSAGGGFPVTRSAVAVAALGTKPAQLTAIYPVGPIKVRVIGVLDSTPAQPSGGSYVVMPLQTLPGQAGFPTPNLVLVAGSAIDDHQLSAVVDKVLPGSFVTFRSDVLAALSSSPLQHGAALIVALILAEAGALGLFIVILGVALGSAERELTLARLTVMGHQRDTGLAMTEAMPAVVAAVVAGAVCALVLPGLIGSSIDLSAFTGTSAPVQFQPDALALGLPAAVALVLALAALVAETRVLRRRGVTEMLRAY